MPTSGDSLYDWRIQWRTGLDVDPENAREEAVHAGGIPVFKTRRAGQPPAWKVRFLRRVAQDFSWSGFFPRRVRGHDHYAHLDAVESAAWSGLRALVRKPVRAVKNPLASSRLLRSLSQLEC